MLHTSTIRALMGDSNNILYTVQTAGSRFQSILNCATALRCLEETVRDIAAGFDARYHASS